MISGQRIGAHVPRRGQSLSLDPLAGQHGTKVTVNLADLKVSSPLFVTNDT